jgi:hypothetical protein
MPWYFSGRCLDGATVLVNGRSELLDTVVASYPKWDAGIKMLNGTPSFNNATGVLTVSERLNSATGSAQTRTVQLTSCTDQLVKCVPSARTIAPCGAGMAPEYQYGSVIAKGYTPYQDVFGAVPVQDIGAIALIGLAFVIGLARGLKS